jgi:hypothetical protein
VRRGLVYSAVMGFAFVLPFMVLEWATHSGLPRTTFPVALFVMMWVYAVIFWLVAGSLVASLRQGGIAGVAASSLMIRLALLSYVAFTLVSWVVDQMPCFLGASGC